MINGLSVGGAEMTLFRLLGALAGSGCEARVASLLDLGPVGPRIADLGVPVAALEARGVRAGLSAMLSLRRLVRDFRPHVVQGWMYHANLASLAGARLAGSKAPVLWNVRHSVDDISREKRLTAAAIRLGARLSGRTAGVVYNAQVSARQHEALGFDRSRTLVIANGVDVAQFAAKDDARQALRASLDFPQAWLLVGSVARFHPMKGHAVFLRAAEQLAGLRDDVGFVLVGRDVDDGNEALRADVRARGLERRVRLLGERADVERIVPGLDIFTSSSEWGEGFPNAVAEAMACGVPCVVTDVGDSAHVVGECGVVVEPGNADALLRGWRSLIDAGCATRRRQGERSRRRVEEHFALASIAARYLRLYRDVSGGQ